MSRGYSCEGPTDGAHCASVGKVSGPTADRHVSGGLRLSGQQSRVAWLGVGARSDGDHWAGVNVDHPTDQVAGSPSPWADQSDQIKVKFPRLRAPLGRRVDASINRLIDLLFYWSGLDPGLLSGVMVRPFGRSIHQSPSYGLFYFKA